MADAKFDVDGKITNLDDLTPAEIDAAHVAHRQPVFERAKKAETDLDTLRADPRLKETPKPPEPVKTPEQSEEIKKLSDTVTELQLAERKRQFGHAHGLSPEETDKVFQIAGNAPTKETLDDPFIKSGLEGIRAKAKQNRNTPGSSTPSITVPDRKKLAEMTPTEKEGEFQARQAARKQNR